MATFNEAGFDQKLEAAGDEAISELEQSVEDPVDEVEAEEHYDEPVESEQEVEDDSVEMDASEYEDEDTEAVEDAPSTFEWDGNPDTLPSSVEHDGQVYDLTKVYKAMQGGFTKKMQELAEFRKEYEKQVEQMKVKAQQAERQAAIANDPRPANPTEEMPFEEQQKRWDEITEWVARNSYRKMIESGDIPDPTQMQANIQQQEQAASIQRRVAMIQSQDGYSEEVENAMVEAANGNEYWHNALQSDDGALALFQHVKTKMEAEAFKSKAAELESARVRKKAAASKNATPSPAVQKKAARKEIAENFAKMGFEEKLDVLVDDGLSDFGL